MTINYTTLLGLAQPVTGTETGQWGDVVNDEITSLLEDAVANAATFSVTSGNVTLTTTNGASNQARMSTLIITGSPGTTRNVIAPSQAKIYQVINQSDGAVVIKGSATTGVTIAAGATGTVVWNGSDFVEVNSTSSGRIIKGNLQVTGNLQVDGNTQLGNSTSDTLAVTALVNSNLLFTDATYDIGASGATRPRNLYLSGLLTMGGALTVNGDSTLGDASGDSLTINAGTTTFVQGTANGVAYLNGSKVLTTGSALTFDGTGLGIGTGAIPAGRKLVIDSGNIRLSNDYQIEWGGSTVGLYGNGSTNSLMFFANTAEQMRLTSTGLGIGTSSPASKLEVAGDIRLTGANPSLQAIPTSSGFFIDNRGVGKPTIFRVSSASAIDTTAATLDSSGNLGLGVTPSGSWGSPALMLGKPGAGNPTYPFLTSVDTQQLVIGSNSYWDGTNWKAAFAGPAVVAMQQRINYNQISWHTAGAVGQGSTQSFTQAMTLTAGGVLQVGTTQTTAASNVAMFGAMNGNTAGTVRIGSSDQNVAALALTNWTGAAANNGCRIAFDNSGRGGFEIGASSGSNNFDICRTWGTPDVRIDSSGNLLINTTSPLNNGKLSVNQTNASYDAVVSVVASTSQSFYAGIYGGNFKYYVLGSGQINAIFTSITAISDRRAKTNIQDIRYGLNEILALRPVTFDHIDSVAEDSVDNYGFIADEVEKILPELVSESLNKADDGTPYQTLKMGDMLPVLVKALQEMKQIVDSQAARIAALEAK